MHMFKLALVTVVAAVAGMLAAIRVASSAEPATGDAAKQEALAEQIFQTMIKAPRVQAHARPVHAKGLVCRGTFEASGAAAALSKAPHLQGTAVPVTVRLSDGATDPLIPDNSPNAGPRGLAIRFVLPDGHGTDIVAMSHNGFVVGTGEEFLALQQAVVATDPAKPHPWPVEQFLAAHPLALKFVRDNAIVPASFANEAFFSNNAFVFVNREGKRQAGRYQFIPVEGVRHLDETDAKGKGPNYLVDDLRTRLGSRSPVKWRLVAQLPNSGDVTNDPSIVWPEDRRTVELGTVTLTAIEEDNAAAEQRLAFDPTRLTDGIELSDDPMPALRSRVYRLSVERRREK